VPTVTPAVIVNADRRYNNMTETKRAEDIARVIIDRYRGTTITKDEYILLVATILRQLIDLLVNINPRSE